MYPLFDWHAPLVEWCGGRKIKIEYTGSIPVCASLKSITNELTLTLTSSYISFYKDQ